MKSVEIAEIFVDATNIFSTKYANAEPYMGPTTKVQGDLAICTANYSAQNDAEVTGLFFWTDSNQVQVQVAWHKPLPGCHALLVRKFDIDETINAARLAAIANEMAIEMHEKRSRE